MTGGLAALGGFGLLLGLWVFAARNADRDARGEFAYILWLFFLWGGCAWLGLLVVGFGIERYDRFAATHEWPDVGALVGYFLLLVVVVLLAVSLVEQYGENDRSIRRAVRGVFREIWGSFPAPTKKDGSTAPMKIEDWVNDSMEGPVRTVEGASEGAPAGKE